MIRSLWKVAATTVAVLAAGQSVALAQQTPAAQTQQELRQWAAMYWEWRDTGAVPEGWASFKFSDKDVWDANFFPFADADLLFNQVYAHRLNRDIFHPAHYDLNDLLRDDPQVLAQYREYTITGNLRTRIDDDPQATLNHVALIARALEAGLHDVTDRMLRDGEITSTGLRAVGGEPALASRGSPSTPSKPTTPVSPPPPDDLKDRLPRLIPDSGLPGVKWRPDHKPKPGDPGFDCDDFADAMGAWIINKLIRDYPGIYYHVIVVCDDGGIWGSTQCHAVTVIFYGDYYWIVDAQTGKVSGPHLRWDRGGPPFDMKSVLCGRYGSLFCDNGRISYPSWWKPNYRPTSEPPVWWRDPAIRKYLCDQLGYTPAECEEKLKPFIWQSIIKDPKTTFSNEIGGGVIVNFR